MKVISIILARGGSKGLPKKNILKINNKPLVSYSIEASLKSKYISKTIVSSDSQEIIDISKRCGAEILKRAENLSGDHITSETVISNVLDNISNIDEYDYLVLLQPTSPLRNEKHIDEAFEIVFNAQADSLISCKKIDNAPLKAFMLDKNNYLRGISNNTYPFMRRQDLPPLFMPNGAIYISRVKEFKKNSTLFSEKTMMYEMDNNSSIDIDNWDDLKIAESLILKKC